MHDCSETMKVCTNEVFVFKSYYVGGRNYSFELGVAAVLFIINALACVFLSLLSFKEIQNLRSVHSFFWWTMLSLLVDYVVITQVIFSFFF